MTPEIIMFILVISAVIGTVIYCVVRIVYRPREYRQLANARLATRRRNKEISDATPALTSLQAKRHPYDAPERNIGARGMSIKLVMRVEDVSEFGGVSFSEKRIADDQLSVRGGARMDVEDAAGLGAGRWYTLSGKIVRAVPENGGDALRVELDPCTFGGRRCTAEVTGRFR